MSHGPYELNCGREGNYFARIPEKWSYLPLKPAPRCVLNAIVLASQRRDSKGKFYVGATLLSELSGVSRARIFPALEQFESWGWLKVHRGARGQRNSYSVDLDLITTDAEAAYDFYKGQEPSQVVSERDQSGID